MSIREENRRVCGLDTLRFLAALWVVFGHCGSFPLMGVDRSTWVGWLANAVYGNLFSGPAAVIVFFVISGFCIHYPYRGNRVFQPFPYFVRRFARIGIPLVVAILLARPFGVNLRLFNDSILWSLFAELIYYSLYPFLRRLSHRLSWTKLVGTAFLLAVGVALTDPRAKEYPAYGIALNWLLGLPCWLLGCQLAEAHSPSELQLARQNIWVWRMTIWALSAVFSALRFHSPLGYPWTLNLFSIPVYFWLQQEIRGFHAIGINRLWEWAGKWSYSIYLTHMISNAIYVRLQILAFGPNLAWCAKILAILVSAYVFYVVVEKPAHLIAQKLSGRTRKPLSNAGCLWASRTDPVLNSSSIPTTAPGGSGGPRAPVS
jgi:peptidoglycan/LPS O-acetylase OafA/YrhL